jgi:hypothetical protein
MPWNKDPSGQQKEDMQNARDFQKKQLEYQKQQEREMDQRRKKLNAQQIGMLRSRFGASGGGGGGGGTSNTLQGMSDSAGSLFSRITGN